MTSTFRDPPPGIAHFGSGACEKIRGGISGAKRREFPGILPCGRSLFALFLYHALGGKSGVCFWDSLNQALILQICSSEHLREGGSRGVRGKGVLRFEQIVRVRG